MWRNENHFSIHLFLKQEDSRKLRNISDSLRDAFPDLFIAPPETYEYPIVIYNFPFPLPVQGENYPDTLERYLAEFNSCDLWHPGTIRLRPHSLLINEHCFQLYLTPAGASDQSKLTRITQELKDHYGCEPCTTTVTFAQLHPNKLFSADALETLENLLQALDFEMTAELRTLTLEILYDNSTAETGACRSV